MTVAQGKRLHQLVAHAASAQVDTRISAALQFRIEYGHGVGKLFPGHMMVADNEVYAESAGIGYLLVGLDATVEYDDQIHSG